MALTRIEYGALASSEVMNNNFEYLDNRISALSGNVISNNASINSNIASINSSIAALSDGIQEDLSDLAAGLSSVFTQNGLYVTTYINGTSWYREFFSDAEKTTRVWLEQGGATPTNQAVTAAQTVTLLKSFSNTNYGIQITSINFVYYDAGANWNRSDDVGAHYDKTRNGFTIRLAFGGRNWFAYGI